LGSTLFHDKFYIHGRKVSKKRVSGGWSSPNFYLSSAQNSEQQICGTAVGRTVLRSIRPAVEFRGPDEEALLFGVTSPAAGRIKAPRNEWVAEGRHRLGLLHGLKHRRQPQDRA